MIICFAGFYLVPKLPVHRIPNQATYNFSGVNGLCHKHLTVCGNNIDEK